MSITKTFVDKLVVPEKIKSGRTEQKRYYDDKLTGFGVRVTSGGTKAFFIEKLIHGSLKRITIGHYPAITVEQARKETQKLLGQIATGIDPLAERKVQKIKKITLREVFEDYLATRKSLKASTITDYHRGLKQVVPDWLDKPLTSITKDLILKRHAEHGENKSKARSNLVMRLLRALFNFAIHQYQTDEGVSLVPVNPVKFLSHVRAWYRIERRQSVIKSHQLADWHTGLNQLSNCYSYKQAEMWKDYFLLVLLTGMRREEAASLPWKNIDMKAKTFTLVDTKNRDSHTLPMSDFIEAIFLRRLEVRQNDNDFVFSTDGSSTGHIREPRKAMLNISQLSDVPFTVHDLRRTFITTAESLDISAYALKRLLNHKMNNDVTAGYIITDVERLRKPMQQITDYILSKCLETEEI